MLFRLPLSFHLAVLKREFCPRSHHAGARDTDTLAPRIGLPGSLDLSDFHFVRLGWLTFVIPFAREDREFMDSLDT